MNGLEGGNSGDSLFGRLTGCYDDTLMVQTTDLEEEFIPVGKLTGYIRRVRKSYFVELSVCVFFSR